MPLGTIPLLVGGLGTLISLVALAISLAAEKRRRHVKTARRASVCLKFPDGSRVILQLSRQVGQDEARAVASEVRKLLENRGSGRAVHE